ncbi:hypothetical protein ANN_17317 [Periplaneta americana]|uniref:Odorant receptor n=1 Tax=Periplaneta americana TaxID=6978 RepID=A0ABQ8SU05_PERAM|nr:hypothetical protein ANN_17317 [Periplaneta americana]
MAGLCEGGNEPQGSLKASKLRKDILRRIFLLTECFTWEEMAMRDIRTGNLTIAGWIPRMNSFIKRATLIIAIIHILQCIAKITTSGGLLFQTWYPFNTSTSPTYEFIQISQVMATVRLAALASAFPHLYAYLVCIACTQLHKIKDALLLVKEKYMKIQYGNADNIPTEGNEEHLVQVEVRHIVKHHQQVLRYMKVMQDYMSGILGGVLLFLMLILCIAAFTAVLFDSVRHAAWSSDWVGRPVKYQKAIAFIILISSKGFELSAWNIVPVSNSTLMSMVNESMSLFMFLLTMKDKNEDLH